MMEMANEFYVPYLDIVFGNTGVGNMKLWETYELKKTSAVTTGPRGFAGMAVSLR